MHAIFFDIANGRLGRMAYFGHWLALVALAIVAALAVGISFGVSEHMIHADFKSAHDKLGFALIVPLVACFAVIGFGTMFGLLNLMAKRLRDIGVQGWPVALGLTVVLALVSGVSHGLASALHGILFLVLLFVPSNAVGSHASAEETKQAAV